MDAQSLIALTSLLEHLLADQQWLEALLEQIHTASEMNDAVRFQKLRTEFEWDLSAHLRAEEAFLIPALLQSDASAARSLREDHEHLRVRLAELGAGAELESVPCDVMGRFASDLRAHARLGDRMCEQLSA